MLAGFQSKVHLVGLLALVGVRMTCELCVAAAAGSFFCLMVHRHINGEVPYRIRQDELTRGKLELLVYLHLERRDARHLAEDKAEGLAGGYSLDRGAFYVLQKAVHVK